MFSGLEARGNFNLSAGRPSKLDRPLLEFARGLLDVDGRLIAFSDDCGSGQNDDRAIGTNHADSGEHFRLKKLLGIGDIDANLERARVGIDVSRERVQFATKSLTGICANNYVDRGA